MANDFQDLAAAQRETTKALQTLTARMRRNPPIRDQEEVLRLLTAGAGRPGVSAKTLRTGGELSIPEESRSFGVGSNSASGVEKALNRTARAVRDLGSGLTANTRVLEKNGSAFTSLQSLFSGFGGNLRGQGGLGGFLKSGFGLAGLGVKIAGLFGKKKAPPVFSTFELPPSLSLEVANNRDNILAGFPQIARGQRGAVREIQPEATPALQPQVVVNVNAMDTQSFMDRSNDIARAVRDAMLHMHPVNDLIGEV